jgi:hypothetical protein
MALLFSIVAQTDASGVGLGRDKAILIEGLVDRALPNTKRERTMLGMDLEVV